jgi:hypothetical protein
MKKEKKKKKLSTGRIGQRGKRTYRYESAWRFTGGGRYRTER